MREINRDYVVQFTEIYRKCFVSSVCMPGETFHVDIRDVAFAIKIRNQIAHQFAIFRCMALLTGYW